VPTPSGLEVPARSFWTITTRVLDAVSRNSSQYEGPNRGRLSQVRWIQYPWRDSKI
jgi:hypothetical protein